MVYESFVDKSIRERLRSSKKRVCPRSLAWLEDLKSRRIAVEVRDLTSTKVIFEPDRYDNGLECQKKLDY